MKITKPKQVRDGMYLKGEVDSRKFDIGRVVIEGGYVYICTDNYDLCGSAPSDKYGFKYGYELGGETADKFIYAFDAVEIKKPFSMLSVGDLLKEKEAWGDPDPCMVLGICGKAYFLSVDKEGKEADDSIYTLEELQDSFDIFINESEDAITEVSMDEIAEKFGVDVSKLKVRKD